MDKIIKDLSGSNITIGTYYTKDGIYTNIYYIEPSKDDSGTLSAGVTASGNDTVVNSVSNSVANTSATSADGSSTNTESKKLSPQKTYPEELVPLVSLSNKDKKNNIHKENRDRLNMCFHLINIWSPYIEYDKTNHLPISEESYVPFIFKQIPTEIKNKTEFQPLITKLVQVIRDTTKLLKTNSYLFNKDTQKYIENINTISANIKNITIKDFNSIGPEYIIFINKWLFKNKDDVTVDEPKHKNYTYNILDDKTIYEKLLNIIRKNNTAEVIMIKDTNANANA